MRMIAEELGYQELPETDEANDCGVRACEVAFNMAYEDAHKLLESFGREHGKGTHTFWLTNTQWGVQPVPGFVIKRSHFKRRLKLKRRARHLKKGTWIVLQPEHMFTIRDGVIYDTVEYDELMGSLVSQAYSVHPLD